MDWNLWGSIIQVISVILFVVVEHFVVIDRIKMDVVELKTRFEMFWCIIDDYLPNIIHSPHTPDIDSYLDKIINNKKPLDIEESKALKKELEEELNKVEDSIKKLAIALYIARLDQLIYFNKRGIKKDVCK